MNVIPRTIGSQSVAILLGLFLLKLLLYATLIPPWQIPDEPTHFEYAYLLYLEKSPFVTVQPDVSLQEQILQSMDVFRFRTYLPFLEPETVAKSFREDSFLRQASSQIHRSPPLYYMLGSVWLYPFSPETLLEALYLLRLYSVLLTFLFIVILALLVRWAIPDDTTIQVGAIAFAVFIPQLSFIGVGVNTDNAITLFYAATVATGIKAATTKNRIWIALLVFSVVASVLSKKTGMAAIPLAAFSLLLWHGWNRRMILRRSYVTAYLIILLLFVHVFMTWFIPETARMVMMSVHYVFKQMTNLSDFGAGQPLSVTGSWLLESFWGRFGWLTIRLPNILYLSTWPFLILLAAGAVAMSTKKLCKAQDNKATATRVLITFSGILVLLALFIRNFGDFQPQGRYLFPAVPAFAVWFASGITLLPKRARPWLLIVLLSGLCLFDMAAFLRYALPAFYTQVL